MAPPAGSLLAQQVLIVKQKLKLIELRNDYAVLDPSGRQIGAVVQATQSPLAFHDQGVHQLGRDPADHPAHPRAGGRDRADRAQAVVHLALPGRAARRPAGGRDHQAGPPGQGGFVRLGKARFTLLDPRGAQLGEVRAHNWRAKDFSVFDGAGQAIARVTKRWAGLRELFTDADTYVVEVSPSAVDPLRSLAVATCLVIDVVMKQKDYAD